MARNKRHQRRKRASAKTDAKDAFLYYWRILGDGNIRLETEWCGIPKRQFRFDVAFPNHLVAVEIEGACLSEGGTSLARVMRPIVRNITLRYCPVGASFVTRLGS